MIIRMSPPSLGAAILAGVGAGIYPDVQTACERVVKTKTKQAPDNSNNAEYEKFYQVYRSLYPSLKGNFEVLAKL